jgi:phosphate transport system substrate-binding protein
MMPFRDVRRSLPKTLARMIALGCAFVAFSVSTAAAAGSSETGFLDGGSVTLAPLMADWATNFNIITGDTFAYDSDFGFTGSGAGIRMACSGAFALGASESPIGYPGVTECQPSLTGTAIKQSRSYAAKFIEMPWAATAYAMIYRIPVDGGKHYITNGLHLSATDLAKIYMGKITRWSQLQSEQYRIATVKGHKTKVPLFKYRLPDLRIVPIYQTGESEAYAFTNFLSKGDAAWRRAYGAGSEFPTTADPVAVGESDVPISDIPIGSFPVPLADPIYPVTTVVGQYKGTIAYVGVKEAIIANNDKKHIAVAAIRNAAGNYEYPNYANISAATKSIAKPPAQTSAHGGSYFGMNIQDPPARYSTAYPISTYTYAVVPRTSILNDGSTPVVKKFLTYTISKRYDGFAGGLTIGTSSGYVALSPALQAYDKKLIAELK